LRFLFDAGGSKHLILRGIDPGSSGWDEPRWNRRWLLALHSDNDPLDDLKGRPAAVVGAQVVTEHFGPGVVAPLVGLVPPHEAPAAVTTIRGMANVEQVSPSAPLPGYTSYSVTLSVDPYSTSGYEAIVNLRDQLARHAPGSLVGGQSAIQYDTIEAAHRDNAVLIPLVLLVILIVIAALLQAIVAPLVLVATAALSFGTSFGFRVSSRATASATKGSRQSSRCTSSSSWWRSGSTTTSS
jgi:putative drug exporter of the RND superfamily